eukprot:gb/GEZN01007093.1/.p1 GENE.gb/GEZN01007093.1/~~gb/GEZN01007093.1/.p1  ORF type:complete len:252 (+),score=16.48 gb/GEZN01007093.1/:128-883(+)
MASIHPAADDDVHAAATPRGPPRKILYNGLEEAGALRRGKVGLVGFLLHKHSLLGLCFGGPKGVPMMKASKVCCCCLKSGKLSFRHRMFVFFFIVVAMLTLVTSLHTRWHGIWYVVLGVVVVTPLACIIQGSIGDSRPILSCLRLPISGEWGRPLTWVEGFVIVLSGYALYNIVTAEDGWHSLQLAVIALLVQWAVSEPLTLLWKFFFCSICCPCCVPEALSEGSSEEEVVATTEQEEVGDGPGYGGDQEL